MDESGSVLSGKPLKSLHGHGHFVSDVVLSSDGQYALSGSWDKTLRLWDLNTYILFNSDGLSRVFYFLTKTPYFRGITTRQFVSHTKDVLSVAFSADNRQIVSGARDKKIKLWNTLAQCKHTIVVFYCLLLHSKKNLRMSVTLIGFRLFAFHHLIAIRLLFPLVGTNWSKFGTWEHAV